MPSGVPGAAFNLIVSIVGCGILSFPAAFRDSGIFWGFIMLSVCTFFSYISLKLLIVASDTIKTQFPDRNIVPSFPALAMISGGRSLALFTQIVVIISLWGSANSRILGSAQIIVSLYSSLLNEADDDRLNQIKTFSIIAFTVTVIFPLGLMRSMSSLKFTSILSVMCSVFLSICLLVEYAQCYNADTICFWTYGRPLIDEHIAPPITLQALFNTIPIFIFGFNCHPSVFPIYKSLADGDTSDDDGAEAKRMSMVFKSALSLSVVLYTVAGSCGFLLFLDETPGNILDHDFSDRIHMDIAKVLFAVAMILAVPTFVNAIRTTCNDMLIIYRSEVDHESDTEPSEENTNGNGKANAPSSEGAATASNVRISDGNKVDDAKTAKQLSSSRGSSPRLNTLRSMQSRIKTCESLAYAHSNNAPHPMVEFTSLTVALSRALSLNANKSNSAKKSQEKETIPSTAKKVNDTECADVDAVSPPEMMLDIDVVKLGSSDDFYRSASSMRCSPRSKKEMVEDLKLKSEETENQIDTDSDSESGKVTHVVVSCIICIVLAVPAIFVDQIDDVFRVLGCTSNPVSGYILPTCFVLVLVPSKERKGMKVIAVLMSLVVAAVSISAFYQRICEIFDFSVGF